MPEYLGDGIVSVKADIKDAMDFFSTLGVSEKTIGKAILRSVGQGGRKAMRKGYNAVLKKRTGTLYRSLKYIVYRNGKTLVFTNDASSGKRTSKDGRVARYGFMLASGYTVNGTSEDGTKWSRTVTPRDFTEGPVGRFMKSNDCENRIDKAIEKQITKIEKKLGVEDGQ